jgi:hypothetical protein
MLRLFQDRSSSKTNCGGGGDLIGKLRHRRSEYSTWTRELVVCGGIGPWDVSGGRNHCFACYNGYSKIDKRLE